MKKNLVFLCLLSFTFWANAQQNKKTVSNNKISGYTINGYIEGYDQPYIYLSTKTGRDSIAVKNGKFSYKGKVDEPCAYAYLSDKNRINQNLYLENVPITIEGKISDINALKITGGKIQQDNNLLKASITPLKYKQDQLYGEYENAQKAKDSIAMELVVKKVMESYKEQNNLTKAFIKSHPKSYVSLSELPLLISSSEYSEMHSLFQSLNDDLKKSALGKKVEAMIEPLKNGENGKKMIDFTQNDVNGKSVSFSSFKGKYVLVDFWASWCGPCRAENPNVLKAYEKFSSKGFTVIGVSLDDNAEAWKKAIEEDKLPWSQVSDLKGFKNELASYYGIRAIPSSYLVDPNGVIVARNLRGKDLEDKLEELIK